MSAVDLVITALVNIKPKIITISLSQIHNSCDANLGYANGSLWRQLTPIVHHHFVITHIPGLRWSFNLKINQQISDPLVTMKRHKNMWPRKIVHHHFVLRWSFNLYTYNTKLDRNTVCNYVPIAYSLFIRIGRSFLLETVAIWQGCRSRGAQGK